MSERFKVGEIAIHKPDPDTDPALACFNGEEVEVIGPLATRLSANGPYYCYDVRHASGFEFYAAPHELRRRKPPASLTGERMFMKQMRDLADKAPQRQGEPA